MSLVAGVDSSTQSTKVELRNIESGRFVARASRPHPSTSPPISEQDPRDWWAALVGCLEELSAHLGDVVAISIGGQQHGLVMLDDAGRPLRPAKLWNDTTSAPQSTRLIDASGPSFWASACGSVPVAAFTISKLAWVAENEAHLIDRIVRLMLPHDYLTYRLTGNAVTDRGDASGTGWFDASNDSYRPDLLDAAGCGALITRLPRVLAPSEIAGEVVSDELLALGLGGVVVGPGTGDNMAAALGLGLEVGDHVISLGTSGTVYARSTTATADESGAVAGFADATGRYLPLVCTLNATKVTDTVAGWLGTDAAGLADLASSAAADVDGPLLVPYFDGERTPNLPLATGSLLGLRNETSRESIALAAHDGVLCGLLAGRDALDAVGVDVSGRCFLVGGGSRSIAYRQRAADLRNSPVTIPNDDEVVATGAAVQAAMAYLQVSLETISQQWGLGAGHRVEPAVDATSIVDRYGEAAS
ncbi:MAG: xylulokinase [Actinomycetia bacterium]|nr:xylulokinase [Actinomycetes bacterium]